MAAQDQAAQADAPEDGDVVPQGPSPNPLGNGGEGAHVMAALPPTTSSTTTPSTIEVIIRFLSGQCEDSQAHCKRLGLALALCGGILAVIFSGLLHQAVLGFRQDWKLAGWMLLPTGGTAYLLLSFLPSKPSAGEQLLYSIIPAFILAGILTFWWQETLSTLITGAKLLKTSIKLFLVALAPCLLLVFPADSSSEGSSPELGKIIWIPIIVAVGFELWWNLTKRKRNRGSGAKLAAAASSPLGLGSSGESGQTQEEGGHENAEED